MKITVESKEQPEELKFPCLMKYKDGKIALVKGCRSHYKNILLPELGVYRRYYGHIISNGIIYFSYGEPDDFTLFHGKIILEND